MKQFVQKRQLVDNFDDNIVFYELALFFAYHERVQD